MTREPSTITTTITTPSADRNGTFWHRLTARERAALIDVSTHRNYLKGTSVIRAADPGRWAVILLRGRVRLTYGADARVVAVRYAGDIVGEQRIVDRLPQQTTVLAETTVQALVVDGIDVDRVISRLPHVLWVLTAVMSERLRECYTRLAVQSADAFTRIVHFLIRAGTEHGKRSFSVHIGSQEALGAALDISRDSVIRALRRLRADNVITTRRSIVTVLDAAKLRACLD